MKAFLKGIIALAPFTCITPALIATPNTSHIQTTTVVGASIADLHIQVDLAQKPYKYDLPTIDDTTILLDFKQSIITNVHENKSVDLKINELLMYYQTPGSDRLSLLSKDTQTLAECGVKDEGIITVIINGTSGFSDLWIIWVFLGILGLGAVIFGSISFSLRKHKKQ